MSDTALLGGSDEPAHLDGYGSIPAELARELVAGSLKDDKVEVRRLPRRGRGSWWSHVCA